MTEQINFSKVSHSSSFCSIKRTDKKSFGITATRSTAAFQICQVNFPICCHVFFIYHIENALLIESTFLYEKLNMKGCIIIDKVYKSLHAFTSKLTTLHISLEGLWFSSKLSKFGHEHIIKPMIHFILPFQRSNTRAGRPSIPWKRSTFGSLWGSPSPCQGVNHFLMLFIVPHLCLVDVDSKVCTVSGSFTVALS